MSTDCVVSDSDSDMKEAAGTFFTPESSDLSMDSPRSSGRRRYTSRRVSMNGDASSSVRKSRSTSSSGHGHHKQKHFVEHNYHDHKHDPVAVPLPPTLALVGGEGSTSFSKQRCGHHKGGVSTPFPERLHQLLEAVEDEGLEHIIGWQCHGRCFIVHKPTEFVETVMSR